MKGRRGDKRAGGLGMVEEDQGEGKRRECGGGGRGVMITLQLRM